MRHDFNACHALPSECLVTRLPNSRPHPETTQTLDRPPCGPDDILFPSRTRKRRACNGNALRRIKHGIRISFPPASSPGSISMVPYKTLKAMNRSRTKVGNLQLYQYGWRVRFKMDSETPTAPESVAGELRPEGLDQLSPHNQRMACSKPAR